MNQNQLRGVGIIVASTVSMILSLQLDTTIPVILVPLIFSVVLLIFGILLIFKKISFVQKPFSIINLGIGIFIGIFVMMFIYNANKNREGSEQRRQLEEKMQAIKKTSN